MKKLQVKIQSLFPSEALLPLICAAAAQFIAYYVPKIIWLIFDPPKSFLILTALDKRLPFVPAFIIVYILAFLQWVNYYILLAHESEKQRYYFVNAEILAKAICMICFIAFPTYMVRPEVTGTDIFSVLTRIIYYCDVPNNLFPSLHCVMSWLSMRAVLASGEVKPVHKVISVVFTVILLFAIVLVKQHVILDAVAGVLLTEFCLYISHLFIEKEIKS